MSHAASQSTVPAPLTARDSRADLIHRVLVAPNTGTESLAKSCASVAMTWAWLAQSDSGPTTSASRR